MDEVSSPFDQATLYSQLSKSVQLKSGAKLLSLVNLRKGDRVLDIGCGTGLMDKEILDSVGQTGSVTGIDPDEKRLNLARNLLHGHSNVEFYQTRSNKFPVDKGKPYDAVVSNMVYHWIADEERMESFTKVFESLKPGGTFAIAVSIGRNRNIQLLVKAYSNKHPEFASVYMEALSSCFFTVAVDELQTKLSNLGFTNILVEQVDEVSGLATTDQLIDWYFATCANTSLEQFNYRAMYEEVKNDVDFRRLPNGELEVNIPTCYFRAEKPATADT